VSIYSTRFAETTGVSSATAALLYTVPSGNVVVVREIDVVARSNTATILRVFQTGSGHPYVISINIPANSQNLGFQWSGRAVFPAGAAIYFDKTVATVVDLTMSGYLLTV
jgi:hypothetical protein